jgi:hypothetical protein
VSGERVVRTVELFYSGQWNDISLDALDRNPVTITRGIANEGGSADAGSLGLSLRNGVSKVNPAVANRYATRNPLSDLFGLIGPNTPVRLSAGLVGDTPTVRTVQEVVSWPPRWDVSERDRWVPLQAAGVLRRLGVASSPLADSIARLARLHGAAAYWPLDDAPQSRSARGLYGGRTMRSQSNTAAPSYGAGTLAPWLPPAAQTNGPSTAFMRGSVALSVTGGWVLDLAYRIADPATWAGDTPQQFFASVEVGDGIFFDLGIDTATAEIMGSVGGTTNTAPLGSIQDGLMHHVRMAGVEAAGNDATLTIAVDGAQVVSVTASIGQATIPEVGLVEIVWAAGEVTGEGLVPVDFGQFVLWATTDAPTLAEAHAAYMGHVGEPAGRRVERLCDEEGVSFASTGDLDLTAMMGPQRPGEFLGVLGECAKVEAAGSRAPILVEQRTVLGLHFNALTSLYLPRDADLTLDWAEAHISPPFDPTPDDFGLANDVTAGRPDGGEHRTVITTGRRGIDAAGRVAKQELFEVASDVQLASVSGWWAWHGTHDEDRYPTIRINMRSLSLRADGAALVAAVQALTEGALIAITNPPAGMPAEDIEQVVLGITETITVDEWLVDLHTTAARPFLVAVIGDQTYGITGSDSTTLNEALDTTETGVDIHCGGGADWVREGVDYDIQVLGERMTVTAVGSASGTFPNRTQTLTVTRSVNGIVKAHASGAPVEMWHQTVIGPWG